MKSWPYIPQAQYDQIIESMPIVSVEAIIEIDGQLLFMRRANEPAKGEWWFPGGRLHRGESLEECLQREILEETGLELSEYRLINVYSRVFPQRHDVTVAYTCKCKRGKITLNQEHTEYALFKEAPEGLHPYLGKVIADLKERKARFCSH